MTQRTITLAAAQDALVSQENGAGAGLGAGQDDHLPIGKYVSGTTFVMRSFIGFEDIVAKLAAEGVTRVTAARLKGKTSSAHLATGGSPRAYLRRITAAWAAGQKGGNEVWSNDNAIKWSNQPPVTNTLETDQVFPGGNNAIVSASVMPLLRTVLPASVTDDLGAAGGGNIFFGIGLISFDEASASRAVEILSMQGGYAPYLELDIDDNLPPLAPTDFTPAAGAVHVSSSGQTLTCTFGYSDPDGDPMGAYQYRVFASTVTDAQIAAGTNAAALFDTGAVAAFAPPGGGVTATGLTRRSSVRPQVRVQDSRGAWGPWSTIDDRLVTLDAKATPSNITITAGTRTPTWGVSSSDADTSLGGTNGYITGLEIDVWTNTGLGRVYLWRSGKQAFAATARATLAYGSGGTTTGTPDYGQGYGWRLRIWDDADQPSDYTADALWTPQPSSGPEIMLPADTTTKQNSITPTFTIGSTTGPFDTIRWRVFGEEALSTLYYDSGQIAVGSTTVRATSVSGQPVLQVNSIAGVTAGDTLRTNHGGGSSEDRIVLSTNAVGPTITFTANLGSTHNAAEPVGTIQTARAYPGTARVLAWGEAPWWDATRRPVGAVALDPFAQARQFRVNALPTKPSITVVTAGAVTRADGVVVSPVSLPLTLRIPYLDADVGLFGELPTRKIVEIRQAATPKGSGTLVETRTNTNLLADDESIGQTLDALTGIAGWVPSGSGGSTTLSAVATNPTGYGGTSLQVALAAVPASGYSITSKDLVVVKYGGATQLKLWVRASSLTNIQSVEVTIRQADNLNNWVSFTANAPSVINTWEEKTMTLGAPSGGVLSAIDFTKPIRIDLRANVGPGGAYTGNLLFRDLRIGTVQTGKTVPDGHLVPESSYDVRGQWGDAVAPGVMGAASDWLTVKPSSPPIVTLSSPADAAVLTSPRPLLQWASTSPANKSRASRAVRVYRRVANQDQEIYRFALTENLFGGAGSNGGNHQVPPYILRTGETYSWEADVVDSDGLLTTSAKRVFTVTFPTVLPAGSFAVTPDVDRPRVALEWTASPTSGVYEWILKRRRGNGPFERIDEFGNTWVDGVSDRISGGTAIDYAPGLGQSIDYQLQASLSSADPESGVSVASEASTAIALEGWWYQVPERDELTLELHYVEDWSEKESLSELVRSPLPDDDGQTYPIVQTGSREGSVVSLTMGVSLEDADQLRILRDAAVDASVTHGFLMSPLGDVWAVKPRAIDQRKGGGAGRRQLTVPFLEVR